MCLTQTKGLRRQRLSVGHNSFTSACSFALACRSQWAWHPSLINTGLMLKPGGEQLQPRPGMSADWRRINPDTWQKVHASIPAAGTQALPDLIETRSSTERQYVIGPEHSSCRVNSLILLKQGWTSECVVRDTCSCSVWFWSGSRNLTNTLIAWSGHSLRFACTGCASHFPKSCRAARKGRADKL